MAKAKTKKNDQEKSYASQISDESLAKTPNPTRTFVVGQKVKYGGFLTSVVKEVLFDGKYYVLDSIYEKENYGKKELVPSTSVVVWHNLIDQEQYNKTEKETAHVRRDIYPLNFSQRDIDGLVHMTYQAGVDLNPEYQRGLVWENKDKENLIESIFNYVDIGKFVMFRKDFKTNDNTLYEIIDGKQRLTTLVEFYEDRFTYKGKLFSQLNPSDQRHILNYPVSVAFLERVDKNVILNTFVRLNTGGKPQDPTHIEKVRKMIK